MVKIDMQGLVPQIILGDRNRQSMTLSGMDGASVNEFIPGGRIRQWITIISRWSRKLTMASWTNGLAVNDFILADGAGGLLLYPSQMDLASNNYRWWMDRQLTIASWMNKVAVTDFIVYSSASQWLSWADGVDIQRFHPGWTELSVNDYPEWTDPTVNDYSGWLNPAVHYFILGEWGHHLAKINKKFYAESSSLPIV